MHQLSRELSYQMTAADNAFLSNNDGGNLHGHGIGDSTHSAIRSSQRSQLPIRNESEKLCSRSKSTHIDSPTNPSRSSLPEQIPRRRRRVPISQTVAYSWLDRKSVV